MSDFATISLIVSRQMAAVRMRRLPIDGEVTVAVGDTVEANTVVARALLPGSITPVGAAAALSVPPRELAGMVLANEGEKVESGQTIARVRRLLGLWKVELAAPVAGTVCSISTTTGQILIEGERSPLALEAYLPGKVIAVEDGRGVTIESSVSMMQGAFGIGAERYGPLVQMDSDKDLSGAVVWTPESVDLPGLRALIARGAVGAIVGSVSGDTIFKFAGGDVNPASTGGESTGLTLVVTEGFGQIPMALHIQKLLKALDGERVSINGATQVRAGVLRPEVVGPALPDIGEGEVDQPWVRIVRGDAFGRLGVIEEEPAGLQRLESGVEALVYKVKLDDGRVVTVPRVNTERF